jgi:hypothetical protein
MYLGVYRRAERDARAAEWQTSPRLLARVAGAGGVQAESAANPPRDLPLPSESAAMVAMASAILGPPRHGLQAFACGWHCQMQQGEYESDAALEGELKSLELLADCGLDGVTDSHPWGGETAKMAGLREADRYVPGPRVRRFLGRARELGLKVTQWPTMNNTHPWKEYGGPFRLDRPDWLRGVEGGAQGGADVGDFRRRTANCVACAPFHQWLTRTIVDDALGTGLYDSWCMDGDFWGTGAYFHSTVPVTCFAGDHGHVGGDANYACQRALSGLIAEVRRRYPGIYVIMCRPPMDLGVWAQRNVDACFTLIESGTGGSNIVGGDEIRSASRIRVHHQFTPHWLDQSLLFPSYASPEHVPAWPSAHIDYIMASALSCSPNLLLYLPTKTGIPAADKAEIRKWLQWGRRNTEYLMVRHDLFDWPDPGRVDGSAHLRGDHGVVFLFNPAAAASQAELSLTPECVGFVGQARVEVRQEYPSSDRHETHAPGDTVRWPVPAESAVVLRVGPRTEDQ